jgi:hypothetical protein
MIFETALVPDAKGQYTLWLTEWSNRAISDILYFSNSPNNDNFPPILIDFVLRLIHNVKYKDYVYNSCQLKKGKNHD